MIVHAAELAKDPEWRADVVIVGSGASGAVWAERLAEAGLDVMVLEEGGHYTRTDFTQREDEMYPLLYRNGANQLTADERVSVVQGRCVGGSTVVNMADVERIPTEVLEHWRGMTGISEFREDVFRPYFERCETMIGVNRIPVEQLNENNDLLRRATEKLGHAGSTFRHNRVNCVGSGYCLIGCAYDAKQSTALTFLPKAMKDGARVVTGALVEKVRVKGGRAVGVEGMRVDPKTRKTSGRFAVKAKWVVLAAGAIHTPLLLQRSGIGNDEVGRNLSLQPQLPFLAVFKHEVRSFRGIPQAYYNNEYEVLTPEGGLGGFIIEAISGGPGMSASALALVGAEHKTFMKRFVNSGAAFLLVPDRPGGSVSASKGLNRATIEYDLQEGWRRSAIDAVRKATEIYFEAGAELVCLPTIPATLLRRGENFDWSSFNFDPGRVHTISAHPQGTCRIGTVTDDEGRVKGVNGVYVIDASLFPTTASTHTMIPIQATADWLADKFLAGVL